mmetsp:Transcript_20521/g.36883  ORF Transcript_20521/g.36883 Transcript_20521/m.36883 type:complete len:192 (+) Transcript_20521:35-610(+)|eukprot:CAMPEP_0197654610 /NCGR_PEP_ID=MMETSP1338-20131121/38953_1 /TAXON_ID=43686 ORGANISM="Pelagodinium beii, Strain RCC1491" /NCGR_SAMPLE_ID=MMETSP1338 /ASSEMBLY_ACC=CAM_ASM_000754 /LENGTH=191 /DNA_ID=CAMNT_0043230085 /DNA_START=35 /DNA_END=610 /DNA_ORIENTATION=+
MASTFMNPAHTIWQERVDKERRAQNKHLYKHVGKHGMAAGQDPFEDENAPPLHDLHRTFGGTGGSTPTLPKIPGAFGSDFRPTTGLSKSALDRLNYSGDDYRLGTGQSRVPSLRSASEPRLRLGTGRGSDRGSMRSSATGLTTESLRREVQDAVAMEVAKVVQPLKEKLQSEQMTRQRLEEMLKAATGEAP